MLIKICGITRPEDAAAAVAAGADLLGFVFRSGTPRALEPKRAQWIQEVTGAGTVGVFMDAPLDEVRAVREKLDLRWVQLHGAEPDSFLEALGTNVIRRVRTDGAVDWERVRWLSCRCLPLFDPGAGAGAAWDWDVLRDRPDEIRFGLAGGLDPGNVAEAVRVVRPTMVDVSSGVEASPGIKDHARIRDFIAAARGALA